MQSILRSDSYGIWAEFLFYCFSKPNSGVGVGGGGGSIGGGIGGGGGGGGIGGGGGGGGGDEDDDGDIFEDNSGVLFKFRFSLH